MCLKVFLTSMFKFSSLGHLFTWLLFLITAERSSWLHITIFASFQSTSYWVSKQKKKKRKKISPWPCLKVIFPESEAGISKFHELSVIPGGGNRLSTLHLPLLCDAPSERRLLTARNVTPARMHTVSSETTNRGMQMPLKRRSVNLPKCKTLPQKPRALQGRHMYCEWSSAASLIRRAHPQTLGDSHYLESRLFLSPSSCVNGWKWNRPPQMASQVFIRSTSRRTLRNGTHTIVCLWNSGRNQNVCIVCFVWQWCCCVDDLLNTKIKNHNSLKKNMVNFSVTQTFISY